MPTPTKITAILTARPGKAEELEALLVGMAPHCRAEPGNLRWDVWQDQSRPDCYVLDELYVDDAAVAAHRETPLYKNYLSRIPALADRTALVLSPTAVEQSRP
jgi:quinol monooxygenase YgiN